MRQGAEVDEAIPVQHECQEVFPGPPRGTCMQFDLRHIALKLPVEAQICERDPSRNDLRKGFVSIQLSDSIRSVGLTS